MSGPVIADDQWPEWADRHCWDEDGCGEFYGAKANGSTWMAVYEYSDIPLPTGHDWRVPVMRHQPVDLEQFRDAVEKARDECYTQGFESYCKRLLAVIDWQANR